MQLDIKTVGWGPAHSPTKRRTELFADWIEAQAFVLGHGNSVSKHDIADRLEGTSLVVDSDDGWTLIEDAFRTCRWRLQSIGNGYPFSVAGDSIELCRPDRIGYLFCLLVSLPEQLQKLRTSYNVDFRNLFEKIVVESLRVSMPAWSIYPTGWSAIAEAEGKGAIVGKVGAWVLAKQWDETVFPNANDAQVDIAAVRAFGDARGSFPVILGQCATGVTDWKAKACRPNLDRWNKAVQFGCSPTKLFAVPFSLDSHNFWEAAVECSGLVLDRTRICMHLEQLPEEIAGEVVAWMELASEALPVAA